MVEFTYKTKRRAEKRYDDIMIGKAFSDGTDKFIKLYQGANLNLATNMIESSFEDHFMVYPLEMVLILREE